MRNYFVRKIVFLSLLCPVALFSAYVAAPFDASNGLVGINNSLPSTQLDVVGIVSASAVQVNGTVTASFFVGNGSQLAGLSMGGVSTTNADARYVSWNGTLGNVSVNGTISANTLYGIHTGVWSGSIIGLAYMNTAVVTNNYNGGVSINGVISANNFVGSSAGLTGLPVYLTTSNADIRYVSQNHVGNVTINGVVSINGLTASNSQINGTLGVTGLATLASATLSSGLTVNGVTSINGLTASNSQINGTLGVTGLTTLASATLSSGLTVNGVTSINSLTASDSQINGALGVTGLATLASATLSSGLTVNGVTSVNSLTASNSQINGTLGVTGLATLASATVSNGLTVNGVTSINSLTASNSQINGTLGVTGLATLASATLSNGLTVNGVISGNSLYVANQAAVGSLTTNGTVSASVIVAHGTPVGYAIHVQALTSSPADSVSVYFGELPKTTVAAAGTSKIYIRKAGTLTRAEIYCYSGTAGTAEAFSLYVRLNNTTDYLIATVAAATNERIFSNTAMSVPLVAGDYIEIKTLHPLWATNPLTTIYGGYLYIE